MPMLRSETKTVVLRNTRDSNGEWIDLIVSIGSWITMQPQSTGKHAVPRAKLHDLNYHHKSRVKDFIYGPGGMAIMEILVEHMYDAKAIARQKISERPSFRPFEVNALCSSDFVDRVDAKSVTSVLQVYHSKIGKAVFEDYTMSELREKGIWFHRYHYTISARGVEKLVEVDPPGLKLMAAEFTDSKVLLACKEQLGREIYKTLTERGGVRCAGKLFLPINLFSFLFQNEPTVRSTPKMYVISKPSSETLESLICNKWKRKEHVTGNELTECAIAMDTITFRYRISKQNLYFNYFVKRNRRIREGNHWVWKPVEERRSKSSSMELTIACGDFGDKVIDVEEGCTLLECRDLLDTFRLYGDFYFLINDKKVGYRRESSTKCKECQAPNKLSIKMLG